MVSSTVKEIIYFCVAFCLFVLSTKISDLWQKHGNINEGIAISVVGVLYILVLVAIYFLVQLNKTGSKDNFELMPGVNCPDEPNQFHISPYARCAGGPYMWNGDLSYCWGLSAGPQGNCKINSLRCPTGYIGRPMVPFEYTKLSDDSWSNARCKANE